MGNEERLFDWKVRCFASYSKGVECDLSQMQTLIEETKGSLDGNITISNPFFSVTG